MAKQNLSFQHPKKQGSTKRIQELLPLSTHLKNMFVKLDHFPKFIGLKIHAPPQKKAFNKPPPTTVLKQPQYGGHLKQLRPRKKLTPTNIFGWCGPSACPVDRQALRQGPQPDPQQGQRLGQHLGRQGLAEGSKVASYGEWSSHLQ